ncbi:BCD family MFS transporter [Erythrobacter sp.]|uniref:BCD family MFS transporter n=1 Tax=Erythrobacter sp. TaxID=1042 RepID=UPI001425F8B5|nr:BCD family MFS transporter [Erythrobacter sp.]QIQ85436.1 MAG: BCD family MFS transporter [Erythrobacter sp.]
MQAASTSTETLAGAAEERGFGWLGIVRIGLVQASIGALVMLVTTVLNRVMVVEIGLVAAIPAGLVAWHYAVQLARPLWGHGSDRGSSRTAWIIGGVAVLGAGALMATQATILLSSSFALGFALAVLAYTLIGAGVGAAGTSALAMLASGVSPRRRAAAAAVTWIMMVAGIVAAAFSVGALLEPFSFDRLLWVSGGVGLAMLGLSILATFRLERQAGRYGHAADGGEAPDFKSALSEIWREQAARRFTVFIFVSMIAFSMQDLILEPFAGLVFGMAPGESTQLGGQHQGGILLGMIIAGVGGSAFAGRLPGELRLWVVAGCIGSALALAALGVAAMHGPGWPLGVNVFVLGFSNGVFAVSAIGAMMGLAGAGRTTREGVRMGVWGASQAIAFGLGGLLGALGVDVARQVMAHDGSAFRLIFAIEAILFVIAAGLALRTTGTSAAPRPEPARETEVFA